MNDCLQTEQDLSKFISEKIHLSVLSNSIKQLSEIGHFYQTALIKRAFDMLSFVTADRRFQRTWHVH